MTQKEITLSGKSYPVAFNLQTMINWESITGKSFFGQDFKLIGDQTVLVVAAILSENPDADINYDGIVKASSFRTLQEIVDASNTVMALASEFFKIPDVLKEEEKKAGKGKGKN